MSRIVQIIPCPENVLAFAEHTRQAAGGVSTRYTQRRVLALALHEDGSISGVTTYDMAPIDCWNVMRANGNSMQFQGYEHPDDGRAQE